MLWRISFDRVFTETMKNITGRVISLQNTIGKFSYLTVLLQGYNQKKEPAL